MDEEKLKERRMVNLNILVGHMLEIKTNIEILEQDTPVKSPHASWQFDEQDDKQTIKELKRFSLISSSRIYKSLKA